jgi:D-sedoheptulose 7-phosphate isomerase
MLIEVFVVLYDLFAAPRLARRAILFSAILFWTIHELSPHASRNNSPTAPRPKLAAMAAMAGPIARRSCAPWSPACKAGGKIMACGNGGSAADSQHFAAELLNRFEKERPPLAADRPDHRHLDADLDRQRLPLRGGLRQAGAALGRKPATCCWRSRPAAIRPTSSRPCTAHEGITVVALTGKQGGKMTALLAPGDIHLCVPADRTARIQEVHLLTIHCLCDGIDCPDARRNRMKKC